MTDRLRSEAERVAAHQALDVRGPWLEWNASLADALNELCLSQQEIMRLVAAKNSAIAIAIATGFREYGAGDDLRRAAYEADALARDAGLQAQITAIVESRAADHELLRTQMADAHAWLLIELAKLTGRQARLARRAPKESD